MAARDVSTARDAQQPGRAPRTRRTWMPLPRRHSRWVAPVPPPRTSASCVAWARSDSSAPAACLSARTPSLPTGTRSACAGRTRAARRTSTSPAPAGTSSWLPSQDAGLRGASRAQSAEGAQGSAAGRGPHRSACGIPRGRPAAPLARSPRSRIRLAPTGSHGTGLAGRPCPQPRRARALEKGHPCRRSWEATVEALERE